VSVLQCVAACCSVLIYRANFSNTGPAGRQECLAILFKSVATYFSLLQRAAVCCSLLQCVDLPCQSQLCWACWTTNMHVGLFCVYVYLLYVCSGLVRGYVGLFGVYVGLFFVYVGLFCVYVGLLCVHVGLFCASAERCNPLQHTLDTVTHCTTLQHTAPHCNTLHHIATPCNTLQHIADSVGCTQAPALISFCRIAMKTCSPLLRSVNSSSRVSSHLSEWRFISFNSCSRARRGYTAWAHPIFLLPLSLSSVLYMRSGSVSCDNQTRVGKVCWMASRRVGYPVVVA